MPKSKKTPTFQDTLHQLDAILAWFDSGNVQLEEALAKYEEALRLSQKLETELLQAKNQVEIIKQKFSAS